MLFLPELYVKCVYLHLLGWRGGGEVHETLKAAQAIKVRETLCYMLQLIRNKTEWNIQYTFPKCSFWVLFSAPLLSQCLNVAMIIY
jgi:hypothetical protein